MCQSSAPAPSSSSTSVAELPEWAKPYAKESLAKAAALTDINKNPYQTYGGQRVAGFQPLQQQAFKTIGGLDAGPDAFAQGINSYMSPYMQNVVDIEKREAARQSGIAGTQQQAQATQAGAFGGGRDAIMRAERERNLAQQMGDIQAKGSQAAYEQAANQFRQGITQQSGLAQLQGVLGQQQQQQEQRPLDVAYQDFLNQKNYPYQQLGYMSDIIRGLPLGQKSTRSIYEGAPSPIQTIGALGAGAYGIPKVFGAKDGGLMHSYAIGGVTNPMDNLPKMAKEVAKLTDEQLQQIIQHPASAAELQAAKMELATRASEHRGLASAYNAMPQQEEQTMYAANGGIVAFAGDGESLVTDDENEDGDQVAGLSTDQLISGSYSPGDQQKYDLWNQRLADAFEQVSNYRPSAAMTEDQRRAETLKNYEEVKQMAGPSPYKAQSERISGLEEQQAGNLEQQKGLAALAAIPEILKGTSGIRGIAAGTGAFANLYGQAVQADRAEKRALMSMKNNLEEAQYKMRVGMVGDARQLTAEARRDKQAADAANIAKQKAMGVLAGEAARLNKPQRPLAQKTPPSPKVNEQLAAAEIAAQTNPTPANMAKVEALRRTVDRIRTSDVGPTKAGAVESQLGSKETLAAASAAKKAALRNEDWQNAATQAEKDEIEQRLYEAELEKIRTGKQKLGENKPSVAKPTPTEKAPPSAVQPLPANPKASDLKDGVVYSTPRGNAKWNAKTQKFTPVP